MGIVTLLTDFGTRDAYVAAVKGVLLSLAGEDVRIVDLGHEIEPGDVEGGAFVLAAATRTFPAGCVHLAVVDPGVGSERRILVALAGDSVFVAPDNGLLTPVLDGATVRSVDRHDLFLPAPGSTFHGRDRFAPVAAALARGEDPLDLGPEIDDPVRLEIPVPKRSSDGRILGRVAHIDRFGNAITDIPTDWIADREPAVTTAGRTVTRTASYYGELAAGEPAIIPGSLGTLELSLSGDSLSSAWGLERGQRVEVALA